MEILQYGYRMGYLPIAKISLDGLFHSEDQTVFVLNQEERDLIEGLQLMYGKSVRVLTEEQWFRMMSMRQLQMHYDHSALPIALPPTFFATYQISEALVTTRM